MRISNLIKYIVWYATQQNITLNKIRLVKFLYLFDLYHARGFNGKILTGLPWTFVYYGPYCNQALQEIDNAVELGLICQNAYESQFNDKGEYFTYTCHEEAVDSIEAEIPIRIFGPLNAAIKKYGDDTAALLDHVYFETEPMMKAKPGDLLDFSRAVAPSYVEPIQLKKLSPDKIELAKKHIKKFGEKLKRGKDRLAQENLENKKFIDETYLRAFEFLRNEDLEPGLEGKAKVST